MRFEFIQAEEEFRSQLLGWIRAALPAGHDGAFDESEDEQWALTLRLRRELANRGWLTLAWPKEYGGAAASPMTQLIFHEEMSYHRVPGRDAFGARMLAPTLMVHGTEEQRRRFLPPVARGEVQWCQGYSEPNSGSDLASLQTRAVADGDEFAVDGTKIWTSLAHRADWIFLLARTDPKAPKHKGISFLLCNMKSPGITVRPIFNMAGEHHFNQITFDNVRVPRDQLVGGLNQGWYVATTLLDFERSGIDYVTAARRVLADLADFARAEPGSNGQRLADDGEYRARFALLAAESEAARLLAYEVAFLQSQGKVPTREASMSKVMGTRLMNKVTDFGLELLGPYGQLDKGSEAVKLRGRILRSRFECIAWTIFAGTNEIQKNIIAIRGLGLPRNY
ncbi:MAG: acyl-CoA dehydrogenase family protein [Chloroflexi bacterium]|nr:acyl-CoA dehydrogenase family protein [Chloroflexota bacterium]